MLTLLTCLWAAVTFGQSADWEPSNPKILSSWAENLDPQAPLGEYPRPQMQREHWQNLNGLWDYKVEADSGKSVLDQGKILVPFPIESALSGVSRRLSETETLWYKRTIEIDPELRKQKRVLLHFGAVDWRTTVYINGQEAGMHEGGFDPFSLDITPYLKKGSGQDIEIAVWDPTDQGPQPRGKQVNAPSGIWYTPVSGIWQTVWLEGVPKSYIMRTRNTPDIDGQQLHVQTEIMQAQAGDQLLISAWDGDRKVSEVSVSPQEEALLNIPDPILWSPKNPHLYDLRVQLQRGGKTLDEVQGYFAMRKISMGKDDQGIQRILLNNRFTFQYGPLDQGWWPGGLYTAPSDAALLFDIRTTKEMGFNMIRKHIKVEPARWYYHCDREGILVWQDMPSGDLGGNIWDRDPGKISGKPLDKQRSPASEALYRKEWKAIMQALYNFPSIVVWTPFNESWGQFKTREITEWTMQQDPTRLVNSASGGNYFPVGHILDIHNYPRPALPVPELFGKSRALVLGEFGGLGLPLQGHTWQGKDNWGYQSFKDREALEVGYRDLIQRLQILIPRGLSAAVYTQTTDVEVETNGLMTYDRKVIKIPAPTLQTLHQVLYQPLP